MSDSIFLKILDTAFRMTASQFEIQLTQDSDQDGQSMSQRQPHHISSSFLEKYGSESIVTALRDFSFPETLSFISSLSQEARLLVLNSLNDHRDLKAALEFGLQYEDPEETERQKMMQAELCNLFLNRLNASNENLGLDSQKPRSGNKRLIDLLNLNQLVQVAGIDRATAAQIIQMRTTTPFKNVKELKQRIPSLCDQDAENLSRFF